MQTAFMSGLKKASEEPKAPQRRRLPVRPVYLLLVAVMALFTWRFVVKTQQIHTLAGQERALKWENQQTAQQNAQLQRDIRYYRTPQYVEEQARAIFGDTLPGEILVQSQPTIVRPVVSVRPAPPRPAAPPPPTYQQWWSAFFG